VRLDDYHFAFTAAHTLDEPSLGLAGPAANGKLVEVPCTEAVRRRPSDVAVIPLRRSVVAAKFSNWRFLTVDEVDGGHRDDNHNELLRFYFLMGYPSSRSLCQISKAARNIHVSSYQVALHPPPAGVHTAEELDPDVHLLLEYDHEKIVDDDGKQRNPPKLQGVSGGGMFLISRLRNRGPLIAIATEHRRNPRLVVGVRIKPFLEIARQLSSTKRELFD
jgi:hypothetical protein